MACLDICLKRSNSWREKGQSELLRSYLKPQKEIQKFTLARWVKIVLRKAGIDTSQFKAHYVDHQQLLKLREWVFPLKAC